ncbi:MAG: hypothetical protein GXP13_06115 [Gammaproteobacteria bacterium]|nr:hypothetical protein [Gammaproteobacteria bacterium]
MKLALNRKFGVLLVIVAMLLGLSACYSKRDNGRVIPKDSVGAISFNGKGIALFDKSGKPIKAVTDKRKGKQISKATVRLIKVNPCYMEWCPDNGICKLYRVSEGACPAWW